MAKPCDQCPWRLANHGKKHKFGFYTKANLRRLWNQVRGGGTAQSCHLTDPSHPDHVAVGAKPGATAQECPGAVILVLREVQRMADANNVIDAAAPKRYLAGRKKGLTKRGISTGCFSASTWAACRSSVARSCPRWTITIRTSAYLPSCARGDGQDKHTAADEPFR